MKEKNEKIKGAKRIERLYLDSETFNYLDSLPADYFEKLAQKAIKKIDEAREKKEKLN